MSILEIALWALFVTVIVIEILRLLTFRYFLQHQHRAPKGHFKIRIPAEQWKSQIEKGALAVAITDKAGQVYMSIIIEREP
jgi:hypothetical protein